MSHNSRAKFWYSRQLPVQSLKLKQIHTTSTITTTISITTATTTSPSPTPPPRSPSPLTPPPPGQQETATGTDQCQHFCRCLPPTCSTLFLSRFSYLASSRSLLFLQNYNNYGDQASSIIHLSLDHPVQGIQRPPANQRQFSIHRETLRSYTGELLMVLMIATMTIMMLKQILLLSCR